MLHFPPPGSQNPIHWTTICLTPLRFWCNEEDYIYSESPSLRAESLRYVAKALWVVADRWRSILGKVDELVSRTDILGELDRLQEVLFDDDSFSTSKRYFWIISFIHEVDSMIDSNI